MPEGAVAAHVVVLAGVTARAAAKGIAARQGNRRNGGEGGTEVKTLREELKEVVERQLLDEGIDTHNYGDLVDSIRDKLFQRGFGIKTNGCYEFTFHETIRYWQGVFVCESEPVPNDQYLAVKL